MAMFEELQKYIANGSIRFSPDDTDVFQLIQEKFPAGYNVIDWDQISHKSLSIPKPAIEHGNAIQEVVTDLLEKGGISPETEVNIVFDNYHDGTYTMSVQLLCLLAADVFSYPQHVYVLPRNGEWCLNYTFTDIIYFGHAK